MPELPALQAQEKTILIVDDDRVMGEMLKQAIGQHTVHRVMWIAESDLVLETARAFDEPATAAGNGPAAGAVPAPQGYSLTDGVPSNLAEYLDDIEGAALRAALERTGHNRTAAAQLLGISFRQMRYRLQRLGLK